MFSMCGIICRFLRGWRQNEAAYMMVQVASMPDTSLLIEESSNFQDGSTNENSVKLGFCHTLGSKSTVVQMLWRDNNKEASILVPKETVDVVKWRSFINMESNIIPSKSDLSYDSSSEKIISVLLEASYQNPEDEPVCGYSIKVEEYSVPFAWTMQEMVGIIIKTTPSKLSSMIHAFFRNALVMDNALIIKRILTVDIMGQPLPIVVGASIDVPWRQSSPSIPTELKCPLVGVRGVTTPGQESAPATPLFEEEEESEMHRCNIDQVNEKAPNILIYTSNNHEYYNEVLKTLHSTINADRYVIYHLTDEIAFKSPWAGSTTLLVICGDVPTHVSTVFIRYLLDGGRVLSICSDFLNVAIPLFGTVEVQDASIVSMTYNKWENVQLLHHQHCFHSSPKLKRFSQNLVKRQKNTGSAVSVEPSYVEITDEYGIHHKLNLEVLAKDNTWGAPSLLVADVFNGSGKAVFSQVHLERDPRQSITLGLTEEQLSLSNEHRCGILRHLLSTKLGLDTTITTKNSLSLSYTPAYFLGKHETKKSFLESMKPFLENEKLERNFLTLQFVNGKEKEVSATEDLLPIILNGCPYNFSTVKYFETLETQFLGRLLLYTDLITSTMYVVRGRALLTNGFTVVANQQAGGIGRSGNKWVSPLGCLMFTCQLHLPLSSNLGQRLPIIQHLVSMACVMAVRRRSGYESIPIGLKWPNDIYIINGAKIGGVLAEASTSGSTVIVNLGCGVNLSNQNPTACINELIRKNNEEKCQSLPLFERETYLAGILNHLEALINDFQENGPDAVIQHYYQFWMHENVTVSVQNELHETQMATIIGIDSFGFLVARLNSSNEMISLHPDGNSFNMLEGLVYTKQS